MAGFVEKGQGELVCSEIEDKSMRNIKFWNWCA